MKEKFRHIIGLSAFYHDSACCVLRDGVLVAAAEEERFSREKHDSSIPTCAFQYCLKEAGLALADVDCIAYYENPKKKADRQSFMRKDFDRAVAEVKPAFLISEHLGYQGPIEYFDHHLSHAASAFYESGFEDAAILIVDGVGEWATMSLGSGTACGSIKLLETIEFPHSLGLLYSAFTSYLGFSVNDGEYKVMGLAPYGRPTVAKTIEKMLGDFKGADFKLKPGYFDFSNSKEMFSQRFVELFPVGPRTPESEILPAHLDLACSIQAVAESILLEKVKHLYSRVPSKNLCLAGGVALNCVANSKILAQGPFKKLFVPPAPGDSGACIGAAKLAYRRLAEKAPPHKPLKTSFWGPSYSGEEIGKFLSGLPIAKTDFRGNKKYLIDETAKALAAGQIVGWFQGRMEFGPRSLGSRSILADPRTAEMRDKINQCVKRRESFRPFAPAVIVEEADRYFDLAHETPFMTETHTVLRPKELPAISHIDASARIQTVDKLNNPVFYDLLKAFQKVTGCPVLLNTSFNLRNEPIVCHYTDALWCFARSEMDLLVLEDFVIKREDLPRGWKDFGQIWDSGARVSNWRSPLPNTRVYSFF